MASTTPARPPAQDPALPTPTVQGPDWPAQAADTIVEQVGKVRDKTTGPALKAARFAVFGAFATLLGTVVLVLFVIGAVRVLDAYLPDAVFGETHMWAAHTLLGLVLLLIGQITRAKMRSNG